LQVIAFVFVVGEIVQTIDIVFGLALFKEVEAWQGTGLKVPATLLIDIYWVRKYSIPC
jgi:hypothetical protein